MAQSVANYMQQSLLAIRDVATRIDSGFTAVNAKFDQIDAELQDIRDRLAS